MKVSIKIPIKCKIDLLKQFRWRNVADKSCTDSMPTVKYISLTVTFFCVTTTAESVPRTATEVVAP